MIAVEGGLSTRVIRAANTKSVRDIASEVKGLVSRATQRLRWFVEDGAGFAILQDGARLG